LKHCGVFLEASDELTLILFASVDVPANDADWELGKKENLTSSWGQSFHDLAFQHPAQQLHCKAHELPSTVIP
jgi:hypothetical protein